MTLFPSSSWPSSLPPARPFSAATGENRTAGPHFLGIGAQKAGTTWLHANLARHPHLFLTAEKELHFWDQRRAAGLSWYQAQFAAAPAGTLAGEITPAYAILPAAVLQEIRHRFPDLRLLYLVRNPIDRAWSAALRALERLSQPPEETPDSWFCNHFRSPESLQRGDYAACLRRWMAVFPPERFLIQRFETLVQDPHTVLTRCALHLGIDPAPFRQVPHSTLAIPCNPGPGLRLRPSLRPFLERLYRPRIQEFAALLNWDLQDWGLPDRPAAAAALLPHLSCASQKPLCPADRPTDLESAAPTRPIPETPAASEPAVPGTGSGQH